MAHKPIAVPAGAQAGQVVTARAWNRDLDSVNRLLGERLCGGQVGRPQPVAGEGADAGNRWTLTDATVEEWVIPVTDNLGVPTGDSLVTALVVRRAYVRPGSEGDVVTFDDALLQTLVVTP